MPAKVLDLSLYGAGLEHVIPVQAKSRVTFTIDGVDDLRLEGVVTRCVMRLERGMQLYRTGLSFSFSRSSVPQRLKELLAQELTKAIDVWKANARGVLPESIERMPLFRTGDLLVSTAAPAKAQSYVWYRLVNGAWQMSFALDPNQPLDGFAVSADDDQTQMKLLCESYERSDEAGRELIRLLAHLSIANHGA